MLFTLEAEQRQCFIFANNVSEAEQTLASKYREMILLRQSLKHYPYPEKYQYQEVSEA